MGAISSKEPFTEQRVAIEDNRGVLMKSCYQKLLNNTVKLNLRWALLAICLSFALSKYAFAGYTLTLDGNGGVYDGQEVVTIEVTDDSDIVDFSEYSFTKQGSAHVGWEWTRPDGKTDWSLGDRTFSLDSYPGDEGVREFREKWIEAPADSVAILYAVKDKYLTQDHEQYRILRVNETLPDAVWKVSDDGELVKRKVLEWRTLYDWKAYAAGEKVPASSELVRMTPVLMEPARLPTPTGLSWNLDYLYRGTDSEPANVSGMVSWRAIENAEMVCLTIYYRADVVDDWAAIADYQIDAEKFTNHNYCSSPVFMQLTNLLESGEYCFTVQALGDGIEFSDSDVSEKSEVYAFDKQEDGRFRSPVHARWCGNEMQWDVDYNDEVDVLGYWLTIYSSENGCIFAEFIPSEIETTKLTLPLAERFGDGSYSFQVVAVPADITQHYSARGFQGPYRMLRADGTEPDGIAVSLSEPNEWAGAASVILAVYDADGRMIGVAEAEPTDEGGSYVCLSIACESARVSLGKAIYMNSNGSPASSAEVFDFGD